LFGATALGVELEWPIWMHYLIETQAPRKPTGAEALNDWRDNGVQADYIKLLIERHGGQIDEARLRADTRVKDAVRVPDISTYHGRYVPPRIVSTSSGHPIEDANRNEYYEIKPNSDRGESDGIQKLTDIKRSYKRYGLSGMYQPGRTYPLVSPTFIPLRWSEAFEYLRLVLMWENNLKECMIDLQVQRNPGQDGLLLYALRIRLELDVELAKDKLRALAAAAAVALAICAAGGVLELAIGVGAIGLAAEAAAWVAEKLAEMEALKAKAPPAPEPKLRIAPEAKGAPRIAEPVPEQLPELPVDLDEQVAHDDQELTRRRKAVAEVLVGRGLALGRKRYDVFCDEDYFQNVVLDRGTANRFAASMRVGLPHSPVIIAAAAAYLELLLGAWVVAEQLVEQIELRFPNQSAWAGNHIPEALRRLVGLAPRRSVSIVSQVLPATAMLAAYIDPELRANARRRVDRPGGGLGRGRIALPPEVLSRWKGRDPGAGAGKQPLTADELVTALLRPGADERSRHYVREAVGNQAALKQGLGAAPGLTLAIGVHGLYLGPEDAVTPANRYGVLAATNVSRLFALTVRDGAVAPAAPYEQVDPAKATSDPVATSGRRYRYLGRIKAGA
jgi:hypothetical protein